MARETSSLRFSFYSAETWFGVRFLKLSYLTLSYLLIPVKRALKPNLPVTISCCCINSMF